MLRQIKHKADNLHSGGSVSPVAVVPAGKGIADVQHFCAGCDCAAAWFLEVWRGGAGSSRKDRTASFRTISRFRISKGTGNNSNHWLKSVLAERTGRIRLLGAVPFRAVGDEAIAEELRISCLFICKTGLSRGLRVQKFILRGKRRAAAPSFHIQLRSGVVRNRRVRENRSVASDDRAARPGTFLRYRFAETTCRGGRR